MTTTLLLHSGTIRFHDGVTLKVDLSVPPIEVSSGQVLILTGDNGSGKSSYLMAVSGGFSTFSDGKTVSDIAVEARCDGTVREIVPCVLSHSAGNSVLRAGLSCQSPRGNVFCRSVADELAFALENSHSTPENTLALIGKAVAELSQFGLAPDTSPNALSKGQQQLLGFASLIQTKPELLFLDEPSASLDDQSLGWLVRKITDLLKSGETQIVCVASQDSRLTSALAALDNAKTVTLKSNILHKEAVHQQPEQPVDWGKLLQPKPITTSPISLSTLRVKRGAANVAMDDITLCPGQCLVVCGPNGVGKTSLLECMGGYLPAASGAITLGASLRDASMKELRRSVAYAFQNAEDQICFMTSEKELRHPLKDKQWLKSCSPIIGRLGIKGREVPWHLSFGQRKLLTYCSLLFSSPVFLADEPFSSLDESFRNLLLEAINNYLKWGGICVITTSHKYSELNKLNCARFIDLQDSGVIDPGGTTCTPC